MKKRFRKTGEIVEVIGFYAPEGETRSIKDNVCYIPEDCPCEIKNVFKYGLNLYKDFEDVEVTKKIDWEEVRIKAAIEAMQVFASVYDRNYKDTAKMAVSQADALIAELKKGGKQ